MHPATKQLHVTLLRLSKGMIAAWEDWLVATEGVKVLRSGDEWLTRAELVAAAQMITADFHRRQRAAQEHAQVS